eukprot:GILJ01009762.1.p1 GENE.GILJ01009762.1~~GILJ01009762.1.p1  ORF type:complete len:345 (+),score=53.54 GILJ01009762.1:35-1036(+)
MPKIELHAHLHGSIPEQTIAALLAEKQEQDPDTYGAMKFAPVIVGDSRTLKECFAVFALIHHLVTDIHAVRRITKAVVESFAEDNVKYLELRTTPRANPATGMTKTMYLDTVIAAIEEVCQNLDITVRLILSVNRAESLDDAEENINLAIKYSTSLVRGVDFSGNPTVKSFEHFSHLFNKARSHGLKVTIHFAEVLDDDDSTSILKFKPDRLGHGCFADGRIRELMLESLIPLEMCPTSNAKTLELSTFDDHHFKDFYPLKYPLCICTDDSGVFSTTLSLEMYHIATTFNLTREQLAALTLQSVDYVFENEEIQDRLRRSIKDYVSSLSNQTL